MAVRVLSVITRLGRGGSDRRLFDVLAAIPAEHLVVIGADSDPATIAEVAASHEVIRSPRLVRSVDPRADAAVLSDLVSLVRKRRVDVVHTHQSKAGLVGRLAARAGRASIVYHSASMASFGPGYSGSEGRAFAAAERVTAPLVSRYFVVGTDLADRLAGNGIARRRLQIVRSSLELDRFTPPDVVEVDRLRREMGVPTGAPVVCFVGRLDERKGVIALPEIVRSACPDRPATLLVAGDGPLRAEVEARAATVADGVDTRMLGHVGNVADVMRAADVLVLPSSAEGLPQVLVQAAAAGLYFVAYDVDGARELLELGARGRVVPLGDERAMADAVRASLADPELRTRSVVAPDTWRPWDPSVVRQQYLETYERDLGRVLVSPEPPVTG